MIRGPLLRYPIVYEMIQYYSALVYHRGISFLSSSFIS
nr:MAG TPA: hypothetical protein [Caudoviricetes sp.]